MNVEVTTNVKVDDWPSGRNMDKLSEFIKKRNQELKLVLEKEINDFLISEYGMQSSEDSDYDRAMGIL